MGKLYIVSTPIGNLKDISLRAIEILNKVDIILAEDTRKTSGLLKKSVTNKARLVSYFEGNEEKKIPQVISWLKDGQELALISSAGTPLVSDPGFKLVRECVRQGIKIVPIPGSSAVLTLLTVSGLPTDKFVFLGFLPKKKNKKERWLKKALKTKYTVIFYESHFRILKTLEMLKLFRFGRELKIVIGREMTKKFEEFLRGSPEEILSMLKGKKIKGELTVIASLV